MLGIPTSTWLVILVIIVIVLLVGGSCTIGDLHFQGGN